MLGQQRFIDRAPPATDHHRQSLELRIAKQLDRCKEGIHVEVGNAPGQGGRLGGWGWLGSHNQDCAALQACLLGPLRERGKVDAKAACV